MGGGPENSPMHRACAGTWDLNQGIVKFRDTTTVITAAQGPRLITFGTVGIYN